MRKSAMFILIIILLAAFYPSSVGAFSASQPDVHVSAEISYNDDKGNGKYQGYSTEYVLQKNFSVAGSLEFGEREGVTWIPDENQYPDAPENEQLVKVMVYINGKAYEVKLSDREYYFSPGFFDYMEEWSLGKARTDKDQIRVVVTSQDKEGKIVQEEEIFNQTFTTTIPTASDFCGSPRSYGNVYAPTSLCSEIKNKQVEKNTQDIQENKKDISQNKEDIQENKKNIETNKENIEQNKDKIDEVKQEVEEIKEKVIELQSDVSGLEAKVKELTDEVDGIKRYILSFAEIEPNASVSSSAENEFKPKELWYREIVEEEVGQVSLLDRFFFGSKVHAAETEWYREKWDVTSELTFEEGHNYEVFLVSEDDAGTPNIEGFNFFATADGLQTEQTDSKGPFAEPEEDAAQEDTVDEEALGQADKVEAAAGVEGKPASLFTIFSLVIGVIGVLVLGIVLGFYFSKRKRFIIFRKG